MNAKNGDVETVGACEPTGSKQQVVHDIEQQQDIQEMP